MTWIFFSILETSPMSCYSIFADNILNKSIDLVAVFWTNIEMSPQETKQLPKWRYLVEKKFQNFSKAKIFFNRSNKWLKIMFCIVSAVELVEITIWWVHVKALEMRMWKLVLGLSLAQILLEKINKMIRILWSGRFILIAAVSLL